jgi:hypothetical protein
VVYSVDIDAPSCHAARGVTSNRTVVTASDSVAFLFALEPPAPVDLLYLDSFDVEDWDAKDGDAASAAHHLKELAAALPLTRLREKQGPGTMIVVDDNMVEGGAGNEDHDTQQQCRDEGSCGSGPVQGGIRGKGRLVAEALDAAGARCQRAFRAWQLGWLCGGGRGEWCRG